MKPYTLFPVVYDRILQHVDYEYWYYYIKSIMLQYVENPEVLLELGCGTGRFGAKFSRDNYEIYGIDISCEMLKIAKIRAYKNFRILCSDIAHYSFSRKFDFIFCVHDTLNYLVDYKSIIKSFKCTKEHLHKKSIFMFDVTTEFNINEHFNGQTKNYCFDNFEVEWSNKYDRVKRLVYSYLTFKGAEEDTEIHIQKIYSQQEIEAMLKKAGLKIIDIYSDYTFRPVTPKTIMINYIVAPG